MNIVLSDVKECAAYLDDLVIYSCDWSSHIATLKTVFECLEEASLTLNLAKCEFGKATVMYSGHQVGYGQVHLVDAKITTISTFSRPTT